MFYLSGAGNTVWQMGCDSSQEKLKVTSFVYKRHLRGETKNFEWRSKFAIIQGYYKKIMEMIKML